MTDDNAENGSAPKARDPSGGEALKPQVQGKLGEKLREVYSDVMSEPVPDRFLELLAKMGDAPNVDPGKTDKAGGDDA